MMCLADLKIWVPKKYNPFQYIALISISISKGKTVLKMKELGNLAEGDIQKIVEMGMLDNYFI